jgi:hypothetical protein
MDEVLKWVTQNLEDNVEENELFLLYCRRSFEERGFDITEGGEGSPNPIYLQVLHRKPFNRQDFNDAMAYFERTLNLKMKREILLAIWSDDDIVDSIMK